MLKHVQTLQSGRDVLRADAGDLAEAADGELSVSHLVQALEHNAPPVSHVGQAAQIGQRLLWRPGLAFPLRQQVT